MCLRVDTTKHKLIRGRPVPLKAENDIVAYKVLRVYNDGTLFSLSRGFKYNKGFIYYQTGKKKFGISSYLHRVYNSDTGTHENERVTNVNMGLHSYRTRQRANDTKYLYNSTIVKVIIPKGSTYYIGKYKDLVSDKLYIP